MPLYFIKLTHAPEQCPSANTKVREIVIKGMPEIPRLAEKLGMKVVTGPLALVTEHESFAVVEADRVEVVQEFLMLSGLMQWNIARVSPTKPLQDVLKDDLQRMPPPLY
jgi:hypothetical protein